MYTLKIRNRIQKDPSVQYFLKQQRLQQMLICVCYQGVRRGIIQMNKPYDLHLGVKRINKTEILYVYKPDVAAAVKQLITIDPKIAQMKLPPAMKWPERFKIPKGFIETCYREKQTITATMRNGHVLKGWIWRYGIFSIRLQLAKNTRVVLLKHGLYKLERENHASAGHSSATSPAFVELPKLENRG